MKKLIALFTLIFTFCLNLCAEPAENKNYVQITGKLVKKWSYGAPNYGENPESDTKEYFSCLEVNPAQTVLIDGKSVQINEVELLFHISVYYLLNKKKQELSEGKNYTVEGRIFPAETGHHHTDYVLLVDNYYPAKEIKPKYRISGKSHNKQIFAGNKKLTHFSDWELIEKFFVSPDESKLLVYHRPNKAKSFLITLYDLPSGKQIAETEPGWACREVRWAKDYLIYIWATSGGGTRFEYRSYKTLNIENGVQSYLFFEDEEEDLLFDTQYFGGNANLGVAVYKFSDGSHIKTFDFIDELYKKVWASGEPKIKAAKENGKGIFVHIESISNFRKTGTRKYAFELNYFFATEDEEQGEDRSLTMEIEIL